MPHTILILGAAGRDFHLFNLLYRHRDDVRVAAFTATQIPDIDNRTYPAALAGPLYPDGISIRAERDLGLLVRDLGVDEVVFGYSDVSHEEVMHLASRALAAGADFRLVAPTRTMLRSRLPVLSVCAVRTGCGKSPTTLHLCQLLLQRGLRPVVVRHPMPYGDLTRQRCQRFTELEDLDRQQCTLEEREEYEPLLEAGITVFAGVDYGEVLTAAEGEGGELILWDGGNNDTPFFATDLHIVLLDPLRVGHERSYHPGETNLRLAEVALVQKSDQATAEQLAVVEAAAQELAPGAVLLRAALTVTADQPERIRGKRVLVIEDGPTLTHGGMAYGAGVVAARQLGAAEVVDPCSHTVGSLREACERYRHIRQALPALGYGPRQMADLQTTVRQTDCDLVLAATPIDLRRLLDVPQPILRVRYRYADRGEPTLAQVLERHLPRLLRRKEGE